MGESAKAFWECGGCDECETREEWEMRIVFESFLFEFEHVSIGIGIEKQKIVRRFTKEIKYKTKC